MTSNSPQNCPFVPGAKIQEPELFVGRRQELDKITSRAVGIRPISINVVGNKRIGKSSLLYFFSEKYEKLVHDKGKNPSDFVAVYLSLQDPQCNNDEDSFYQAVAHSMLRRQSVQNNPRLAATLNGRSLDRLTFADTMKQWQELRVLPILCLDKIEQLLNRPDKFDNSFYDNLSSLMDSNALMLVVTSYQRLGNYRRRYRLKSDFFNNADYEHLELKELTKEEAIDLVRLPDPDAPALSTRQQKYALEWGGRHPYLLQLAGRCLWEARQQYPEQLVSRAKQEFKLGAKQIPGFRFNPRRWWLPLRLLFWSLPVTVGKVPKLIGGNLSDLGDGIVGYVLLISFVAFVLGFADLKPILDLFLKALGLGG